MNTTTHALALPASYSAIAADEMQYIDGGAMDYRALGAAALKVVNYLVPDSGPILRTVLKGVATRASDFVFNAIIGLVPPTEPVSVSGKASAQKLFS